MQGTAHVGVRVNLTLIPVLNCRFWTVNLKCAFMTREALRACKHNGILPLQLNHVQGKLHVKTNSSRFGFNSNDKGVPFGPGYPLILRRP